MGSSLQVRRRGPGALRIRAGLTVLLTAAAVVLSPGIAAAETGDAAATTFPRTPLWVYGHSYTTSPGSTNTRGQEWMPELARQLGFPRWQTFGVGSSRLVDTYADLARQAPRGPVRDSAWTPARRGTVVLQSEFNDMSNPVAGVRRANRLTATAVSNYGQTLQASLAVLASSWRGDFSLARSSGRWQSSIGPAYLGGSLVWTTTPGAYREMTIDVGRSGAVWIVSWDVSRAIGNPYNGATSISVDGRVRTVVPARTAPWESIWSGRAGGYQHTVGPRATKISGLTPGRHVVRVAKADRGPGAVCLDQLLVQSAAPLPVTVVKDPPPVASNHWLTTPANRAVVSANRQLLHPQIDAVVRQFPNVTTMSLDGLVREHYGWDGIHLSDLGMDHEASRLAEAFRQHVARYDVAAMYQ
jgi:hypothetical protein